MEQRETEPSMWVSHQGEPYLPAAGEPKRLITTFYSFKGGVGRSMAMQAVGSILASRCQRVLMVDADMEAPGLTIAHAPDRDEGREGFVDIAGYAAQQVLKAVSSGEVAEDAFSRLPERINAALIPIDPAPAQDSDLRCRLAEVARGEQMQLPSPGSVWLLPVGTVLTDYATALRKLSLPRLFHRRGPDAPDVLLRAAQLEGEFERPLKAADVFAAVLRQALLEATAPQSHQPFDYVFIDSRTGFPDVAGMCVRWLPDRLVVLLGLNDQNISGTTRVLNDADVDPMDRDRVTLVVSPVPVAELKLLDERLDLAKRRLGITHHPILLHYQPWVALSDQPFVAEYHRHAGLYQDYWRLAEEIEGRGGPGASWTASRAMAAFSQGDLRGGTSLLVRLALIAPDSARRLSELITLTLAAAPLPAEDALLPFRVSAALSPQSLSALGNLAQQLGRVGEFRADKDDSAGAEMAFREATELWPRVERLDSQPARTYRNWGDTLRAWADAVHDRDLEQAGKLHEEACEKLARAVEIDTEDHVSWRQWGAALDAWAFAAHDHDAARAEALYAEACKKLQRAAQLKPDEPATWVFWGLALAQHASVIRGERVARSLELYEDSCKKLARAADLDPSQPLVWVSWAIALTHWGQTAHPQDQALAGRLAEQAAGKCARAVQIDPDYVDAWREWGDALVLLHQSTGGAQALSDARAKLGHAEELSHGSATYELACWEAVDGRSDEALAGLERALAAQKIKWHNVSADISWDGLREHERYQRLEGRYGPPSS